MSLAGLADLVLREPALATSVDDAKQGLPTLDLTGPAALRPFVVKGLVDAGRTVLVVAATVREAEDLTAELADLLDPETVAFYPAWETLPHERLSPRSDTVGRRLAVLRRLCHPVEHTGTGAGTGPLRVVVAPIRSVLQPQVKGLADLEPVELARGQEVELEALVARLAGAAYSRVDLVEKRGEFAVRGGIVDVFPPTEEHPLRVEFFGDEVDEIRTFAVADQRTLEPVDRLWAPPCRELLLTDEVRRRAAELGKEHPQLREITDKLERGHGGRGDGVADTRARRRDGAAGRAAAAGQPTSWCSTRSACARVRTTWSAPARSSWGPAGRRPRRGARRRSTSAPPRCARSERSASLVLDQGRAWWGISPFGLDVAEQDESRVVAAQPAPAYRGDVEQAVADIREHLAAGRRVVTVHQGHGPAQRMVEVLGEHDVAARLVDGWLRDRLDHRDPRGSCW